MRERLRFCPRTPSGRSGLTAKRHALFAPLDCGGRRMLVGFRGAPWLRRRRRGQQQMTDPLPEEVSRPVARCIARARDGDQGVVQECRRPSARNPAPAGARHMARGTECGNFNGAAPSRPTGDVRHPVGHHQRTCGTPVAMIGRHAVTMIIMVIKRSFTTVWFVRNMYASF